MELLFESRLEVLRTAGRLRFVQGEPEVLPEPVLLPDAPTDATGAYLYGSVLRDGGVYRMWYQALPADWDGRDTGTVGYAESDDGLAWHKPPLGLAPDGPPGNNLCDLGFHSPAVTIDPAVPAGARYRATGYTGPGRAGAPRGIESAGYYTAHSADGLHWEVDGPAPTWPGGDVITSVYHPGRGEALVALKHTQRAGGMPRRSIWTATLRAGDGAPARTSTPVAALIPDAYDDICAAARGHHSSDYYGMGMMPAGQATVGFLWRFHHDLPLTPGRDTGVFGVVDVSLVYQPGPGEAWLHVHGRPDFLTHGQPAWTAGGIYTAANVVEAGEEQRLYIGGARRSHGWYLDADWSRHPGRLAAMRGGGDMAIGLARWRRDRLFGFRADPAGTLDLDLGVVERPSSLWLNVATTPRGSVRVGLPERAGYTCEDAAPLIGDTLAGEIAWHGGSRLPIARGQRLTARLHLEEATVYAYEVRPLA